MLPIGDDRGRWREAVACLTLVGLCMAGFAWQLGVDPETRGLARAFAFTPGLLFGGADPVPGVPVIPPPATLVTYLFLHAGWLHLLGNLVYLLVFGPRVESRFGPGPFTAFIIACGAAAALGQALTDPASPIPIVGVSGAVSGVLGAYLLLFPRAEIRLVVPVLVVMRIVSLPAYVVLLAWFLFQLVYDVLTPPGAAGIAFRAHVTGFLAGMLLTPFFAPFFWSRVPARR